MLSALDPTTRAIVIGAAIVGLYVLSGLIWPYTACPACAGGKHHSPTGRNWRSCRKCDGSGKKIRLISRLLGRD